jgi:ferredoxin
MSDDIPSFEARLPKPLGIQFEEMEGGGLEVGDVLEGGSAIESSIVWKGDVLLAVEGRDCSSFDFDSAMGLLVDAPDEVTLKLGRIRGKVAAVRFPDGPHAGRLIFVQPGDELMGLAAAYGCEIEYDCYAGSCGVCDMFLQDGENGSVRPVRACKARLPKGSRCSLNAIDVLRPDSPQAQEYNARMAEKLLSQGSKGSVAPVPPPKKQSLEEKLLSQGAKGAAPEPPKPPEKKKNFFGW